MAGGGVSSIQSTCMGFRTVLASAFLEWVLMLLLFIDAIFAYLIVQFARYCELPVPCVLCSRLDHVFDGERVGFYWDLICGNHKSEISSLALCHFHSKLVDVHGMCENCLFSLATKDKFNSETYRPLVGKLGTNQEIDTDKATLHDDHKHTLSHTNTCSCCGQSWSFCRQTWSLLQTRSFESEGSDLDVPSFQQRGDEAEITRLSAESAIARSITVDSSPSFMYKEVKITSDTESEGDKSDFRNSIALVLDTDYYQEDTGVVSVQTEHEIQTLAEDSPCVKEHLNRESRAFDLDLTYSQEDIEMECGQTETDIKTLAEDSSSPMKPEIRILAEGSTHIRTIDMVCISDDTDSRPLVCEINNSQEDLALKTFEMEPLITAHTDNSTIDLLVELGVVVDGYKKSADLVQADIYKDHDGSCAASSSAIEHGLEELNWEAGATMLRPSPVPDLIDIDDIAESAYAGDKKGNPLSLPELTMMDKVPESSSFVDILMEQSDETRGTREVEQTPVDEGVKKIEVENESTTVDAVGSILITDLTGSSLQLDNNLDLWGAYKLAVSNREMQLSGKLFEQHTGKDPTKISGDLRLLWSQFSSPRGFDLPVKDLISPRLSGNLDDYWKSYDPCASAGMQILQKRFSPERSDSRISHSESSIDSLDLSFVSEIEGESELDRLKRQVEHDRKLMSSLCKELEEERNASAIAANQAMAMITRLQEEKATVQMEALQHLRMIEEEAEFHAEALEKINGLLEEKEREIQELESELEVYRKKLPDVKMAVEPASDENLTSVWHQFGGQETHVTNGRSDGKFTQNSIKTGSKDASLELEDEALYISRSLARLEKKLQLFSNTGLYSDLSNGDFGMDDEKVTDPKSHREGSEMAGEPEVNDDTSPLADPLISRGDRHGSVRQFYSLRSPRSVAQGPLVNEDADVLTLAHEFSSLNDRLLALEADKNFLEHAINSLVNGEEGLHFIREIASDLRELRRIVVRRHQGSA